ncbi:MAG: EAL domain-containing protein [Cyanobacteria bacterium J06636_27]
MCKRWFSIKNAGFKAFKISSAINRAKSQGRNHYQIYNSTINSEASELLSLENSLHYALERNELKLYYQPQVDISTGEICKFEALLRWQHPQYGLISPSKFIPIAEETGLIVPISEWVLRTACTQNKIWQNILGNSSLRVAVNLSPRQFQQPDLVNTVQRILTETQLSPQNLELEITESAAMQNVDFTKEILTELYNMGVSISIDDFGTGYCSFSYLKQFPIHCLKIDRSFVRDLTKETNDAAIITAMIALAHGLHFSVVAEGVETQEQRNLLNMLECELMQGNLFSPAVCAQEATELLLKSKSRLIDTSVLAA